MTESHLRPAPGERALVPNPKLFRNRELSYLAYNWRIIEEAGDRDVPLLERLKFIAIVGANLDAFFMVRVAALKEQVKERVLEAGPDGMLPLEQLAAIRSQVAEQVIEQERILLEDVMPALASEGIGVAAVAELPSQAQTELKARFETEIFPMLTPLAVDSGHPFPFLKNGSLNLAVHLVPEVSPGTTTIPLLAVVQVPSLLPRFVDVMLAGRTALVFIEDIITHHVGQLFHGMRIEQCVPFRVLRNRDLSFALEEEEDLLETVQRELQNRRHDAVRLEICADASASLREVLRRALGLEAEDIQEHRGPLASHDLLDLVEDVGRSDLRDELFQPVRSIAFPEDEGLFRTIARSDVLLHHPYESYDPVLRFLRVASTDPAVLAIKQTLYRVNRDSPLLEYLIQAAENGKQVTALVELKARFDEETNVEWARALEQAGVHVVYGLLRLKTHCKVTLVVRREQEGVRPYVHLGTGNYNEASATQYSDLSFFTARPEVGDDVADLFNLLTGYSASPEWRKLVVAPLGLRKKVLEQIERTAEVARRGGRAKIIFKSNALIDADTSKALCSASQAGVETILLIRGPCTLKVGVPEMSDRIHVQMVVDRFLEHARILYFQRDDEVDVYLTSTDLMHRNFDHRVEVMLPIEDVAIKRRLIEEILGSELRDTAKAAVLTPDGRYVRRREPGQPGFRCQSHFIALARDRDQTEGETPGSV